MLNNSEDKIPLNEDLSSWLTGLRLQLDNSLYTAMINNMDSIREAFKAPTCIEPMCNSYGETQNRLGIEKIALLDMVEAMLSCKNPRLTEKIAKSGFLNTATVNFISNIYRITFANTIIITSLVICSQRYVRA